MAATLELRYTGGASNSNANASLGGVRSSVALSSTPLNNLFDDVSAVESAAGDTEYRALDLYNSGDAAATSVTVYLDPDTSSADTRLDLGPNALESSLSVANESTAPAAIVFATYNTSSRMSVPDIPAGQGYRIWFKRVVNAGAANTSADTATIKWEYA